MHLHFVQSIEPLQGGGLGQAALGLHLALRAGGAGSRLITTCGSHPPNEHPGVTPLRRLGPAALYYSPKLHALAREAVAEAGWVHGHGFYVGTNAVIGGEAVRQGKPLCYHPQGFFDPWILRRARWKKWLVCRLFEDRNFKAVRLWRALTGKEVDQIRAVGMKQEVVVLPNGIRLEEIDAAVPPHVTLPHPPKNREHRLLFLGRIHPKKGLDLLAAAWAGLADKFPEWELLVVGPDEGGYLATVRAMFDGAAPERVRFYPAVSGAEKAAVFRSADLFVLPSYSEGFPVAVVEAAAHRLPCVITTECNFPELVAAGGGWECEPTADGFAGALGRALEADAVERSERGRRGRRLVEQRYTWARIAEELEGATGKG